MMQPRNKASVPLHTRVIDGATLYLCRQGPRWVVVIESPASRAPCRSITTGRDGLDAQFELLAVPRSACPDATVMSTDGATDLRRLRMASRGTRRSRPGRVTSGLALRRELSTESADGATSRRGPDRAALPLGPEPLVLGPAPQLLTFRSPTGPAPESQAGQSSRGFLPAGRSVSRRRSESRTDNIYPGHNFL